MCTDPRIAGLLQKTQRGAGGVAGEHGADLLIGIPQVIRNQFAQHIPEIRRDGKIPLLVELFGLETGPAAAYLAAANRTAEHQHHERLTWRLNFLSVIWAYPFTAQKVTTHRMTNAEFEIVFREHKDVVYRFAWRMTGSPAAAEDIAQDVFLTLLHQPGRFDASRAPLRSFLLGVTRNLALKRWRGESRWEELDDERFVAEPVVFGNVETAAIVGKAVQSLPPLQREVLVLAEYEELSLEEIASVVQAEVGTIKSRLHRARENMRHMLASLKPKRMTNGTVR